MSMQIYDERVAIISGHSYLIADGTNPQIVLTAGQLGGRCDNLLASNYGPTDLIVQVVASIGAGNAALGTVSVPSGAGTAGAKPIDLIAGLGTLAAAGIVLPPLAHLYAAPTTAVAADGDLLVVALGGSF